MNATNTTKVEYNVERDYQNRPDSWEWITYSSFKTLDEAKAAFRAYVTDGWTRAYRIVKVTTTVTREVI